jgi:hypothetical protein
MDMALVTVRVPIDGNDARSRSWTYDVETDLTNNNDVVFVDDRNGTTKVELCRVNLESDGNVAIFGKTQTVEDAVIYTLAGGGMHSVGGIHGISHTGTTASISIKVKV